MKALFYKIQCPCNCFCKASTHIYTPGPLKLEKGQHLPFTTLVPIEQLTLDHVDLNGGNSDDKHYTGNFVKSILRKPGKLRAGDGAKVEKKRVQWMDFSGQTLFEIKEFESSETGGQEEEDNDDSRHHWLCMIR